MGKIKGQYVREESHFPHCIKKPSPTLPHTVAPLETQQLLLAPTHHHSTFSRSPCKTKSPRGKSPGMHAKRAHKRRKKREREARVRSFVRHLTRSAVYSSTTLRFRDSLGFAQFILRALKRRQRERERERRLAFETRERRS